MIENVNWSAKDKTWYGSIGDGEAIASKLDELRRTMPKSKFSLYRAFNPHGTHCAMR